jgi:hypothetical protein
MTGIWPTGDGRWCVVGDMTFHLGKVGGAPLVVPAGFVTDLASIPWAFQWLFSPNDPSTVEAAVIHDALLTQEYDQRVAAGEFYRALTRGTSPSWKRRLFYFAVLLASTEWDEIT